MMGILKILAVACLVLLPAASSAGVCRVENHWQECGPGWCRRGVDYGTGTWFAESSSEQFVLTAGHVLDATPKHIYVNSVRVSRVIRHPEHDIAVLVLPRRLKGQATPLDLAVPSDGELLAARGYGPGAERQPRNFQGELDSARFQSGTRRVKFEARNGDSGMPITNRHARVVGVCWGSRDGRTYYTPVGLFLPFLITHNIPVPSQRYERPATPKPVPPQPPVESPEPSAELEARIKAIESRLAGAEKSVSDSRSEIATLTSQQAQIAKSLAEVTTAMANMPRPLPRRVILTEGTKVIDDETYPPGEPIILDLKRLLGDD